MARYRIRFSVGKYLAQVLLMLPVVFIWDWFSSWWWEKDYFVWPSQLVAALVFPLVGWMLSEVFYFPRNGRTSRMVMLIRYVAFGSLGLWLAEEALEVLIGYEFLGFPDHLMIVLYFALVLYAVPYIGTLVHFFFRAQTDPEAKRLQQNGYDPFFDELSEPFNTDPPEIRYR